MIDSLTIKNFQRHRNLSVEFGPGVTTLVGPTDAGKSSVLRALRWIAANRPSGDQFVRWGSKGARATLKVDGREVTRAKGKEGNLYSLDSDEFKAFGTEVPSEVVALLNVSELTFQGQHDPPYWFGKSAGEVSRELNGIINLGLIDSTMANLAAELRKARATVSVTEDRLKEAESKRDGLAWVPEAMGDLDKVGKQESDLSAKRGRIASLRSLLAEGGKALRDRDEALAGQGLASAAVLAGEKAASNAERLETLRELLNECTRLRKELVESIVDRDEVNATIRRESEGICPVCGGPLR